MSNENIVEKELDFMIEKEEKEEKEEKLSFFGRLSKAQFLLKSPKNQYNNYGKYRYRNCEDILESVKPILNKLGLALIITDCIVVIGDRFYIKSEARLYDVYSDKSCASYAYAREPLSRKLMDDSQITGATSSYARKYALNGLFCIDDTKDPDTTNNGQNNIEICVDTGQLSGVSEDMKNSIKSEWAAVAPYLSNYAKEQIKEEFGDKDYFNNPNALKKARELAGL